MSARLLLSTFVVLMLGTLSATPAMCQEMTRRASPNATPTRAAAAVAMQRPVASDASSAPAATRSRSKPVTLMIVGGAAIVIGSAVIGGPVGTLFVIGGAVAFLYGLYQYLQ